MLDLCLLTQKNQTFLGRASSEPHSYVLTWLFVTIYLYNIYKGIDGPTSVFDPAPGVKVGCCGQNLRVVTLCENDLLYWYMHMFLHIRLRIRHWSNLSAFSSCARLSALNHSAKVGKMPSSQRSRDFLLPQGQPESKHVLFFSDLLAHRESLFDKTKTLLLQLIVV